MPFFLRGKKGLGKKRTFDFFLVVPGYCTVLYLFVDLCKEAFKLLVSNSPPHRRGCELRGGAGTDAGGARGSVTARKHRREHFGHWDAGERRDELSAATTAEEEKEASESTKRANRAERRRHATSLWAQQEYPEPPCSRGRSEAVVKGRAPCHNPRKATTGRCGVGGHGALE